MHSATKSYQKQLLIWLLWTVVLFVAVIPGDISQETSVTVSALPGIVQHDSPLLSWRYRLRIIWRRQKRALRHIYQRAVWAAGMTNWARRGALTLAQLVDLVVHMQLRRQLGALPVLQALLEELQVPETINHYCPTQADVDHGTVALALILNRMTAPRPLYQVADWVSQTVLGHTLGVPASKFNDDRLGRTLEALKPHSETIWQDIVQRAFLKADIDPSVLYYDLSAFVAHGAYAQSKHITFGFANNTPANKRKFKVGLDAAADGNIPTTFHIWPGNTTDLKTVQENMTQLQALLVSCGHSPNEVLVVGDRGNMTNELALAYDDRGVRYLAGLHTRKKEHQALVLAYTDAQLRSFPLKSVKGRPQYWGRPCPVTFTHNGREVTHRGLVVLSGPMRHSVRADRATALRDLRAELHHLRAQIGQPRHRTVESLQRKANALLARSAVGKFMEAIAYLDDQQQLRLRWRMHRYELLQAMRHDGRYLLVTNDPSLSYQQMFELYLAKDGVEKCFHVTKHDLQVSPIYLHKDERIEGMLLINMLALLAYSLVQRQVQQAGWHITTRQIINKLASVDIIETHCWDGSVSFRLVPLDPEQSALFEVLTQVLTDLRLAPGMHLRLPSGNTFSVPLPPALLSDPPPALPLAP
jgi:transposase